MIDLETSPDDATAEQFLAAAEGLQDSLRARAADAEVARRLSDDTIADLYDSGLIHMKLPRHLGGADIDMLTEARVNARLARSCPSTSWVRAVLSGATGAAALLPVDGVDEIFGSNPRPLVCGVTAIGGTAVPVNGGWLVDGAWSFASGCLHSDWAGVAVRFGATVDQPDQVGAVFMPAHDFIIKDTWHVAGLCATGSNTIVAERVFVPAQRAAILPDGITAMLQRSPQVPRFAAALLGPLVGAAEELLAKVVDGAGKRGVNYFDHALQRDSDALTLRIGEAAMRLESAWLHTERAVADLTGEAAGTPMSYYESTRGQADCAYAAKLLRELAMDLISVAGASSFANANVMQRFWRDITVGSNHAMLNATASLELHGRTLLGRPSNSPFWGPEATFLA